MTNKKKSKVNSYSQTKNKNNFNQFAAQILRKKNLTTQTQMSLFNEWEHKQ